VMCDIHQLSAAYASLSHVAHRDLCQRFPIPAEAHQRSLCKDMPQMCQARLCTSDLAITPSSILVCRA
jgi:hypothetical protein